ncbi:MAG: GTP 3',8-cyclase MoaA [Clostridia bacterium]|nr:GTP 3',8-cyclase MoaA [Clostridia bacterium]
MIDKFERNITYLRLSVTELCNLRCRYCMPEDGVCKKCHDDILTEDEMVTAVEAAAAVGVNKLRITGGEPLVKKNILSICERCAKVDGIDELCITTNGTLLTEYAKLLRDAGISRINVSLDTLDPDKNLYITRRNSLEDTMNGIRAAIDAGFKKVKINTVLIGGFNDDEIYNIASLTQQMPVDVRFIELMPMYNSGDFDKSAFVSCEKVVDTLTDAIPVFNDGVAKLYKLPNAIGNVGIISPISSHFCNECNRIRITADGKIKPCLHSDTEISIKGLNKDEMISAIKKAISEKPQWHGDLSYDERSKANRNMNQIGG